MEAFYLRLTSCRLHDTYASESKKMDAGKYYALLRFEAAALALRAALKLGIVDKIGDRVLSQEELRKEFGFTQQATRTFVPLLEVMEILQRTEGSIAVTPRAKNCLFDGIATSRRPYLSMGTGPEVDAFVELLQGKLPSDSIPFYAGEDVKQTVMDIPDVAREIAFGLSSRARNFAQSLAAAIKPYAANANILADVGAGSPYVAYACLSAIPTLSKAVLVDRSNGMQYAREIAEQSETDLAKIEFCEQDFFQALPAADIYCISNTAHDWLPSEYSTIVQNVRRSVSSKGVVCLHEPLLASTWESTDEWVTALWMACYAMTLFRLTEGKGTCYTREEHDDIMKQNGFIPAGAPVATSDGCTALFYRLP